VDESTEVDELVEELVDDEAEEAVRSNIEFHLVAF
jgi:hypothetical protein